MPCFKPVQSLHSSALNNVLQNMENLWCANYRENYNATHCIHVVGPFDSLPAKLNHEIFVELKKKKKRKKHHIYLLIHPNLQLLDCSKEDKNDLKLILELVSHRCTASLQALNLSFCTIPKEIFLNLISISMKLSKLDLSHSNADDGFMGVLGVYGHNIKELNVSYTKVSDRGLRLLALAVDEDERENERFGKCRNLTSLKICHSRATRQGATDLLSNLEDIIEFEFENSVSVVYEILQNTPDRVFKLLSLHSSDEDLTDEALASAVLACPHANHFYLHSYNSMNEFSLTPLAFTDAEVKEIHFINEVRLPNISFMNLFPSICQNHGESLISVHISEIDNLNLALLTKNCPSLRHLNLSFINSYLRGSELITSSNVKLVTVQILCSDPDSAQPDKVVCPFVEDLERLLVSKELASLVLGGCDSLTDEAMERVLEKEGAFAKLRELTLSSCNNVSVDTLLPLLLGTNELKKIDISSCMSVTHQKMDYVEKQLKKQGLLSQVSLSWD